MRGPQHPGPSADGNLPLELTAFVGRSAELGELARALESGRLVTVTGVGGVGKSRLAWPGAPPPPPPPPPRGGRGARRPPTTEK
ncbi:hypothetical protein ACWGJB_05255, partial [Streptomyces sp. NPDC054813]